MGSAPPRETVILGCQGKSPRTRAAPPRTSTRFSSPSFRCKMPPETQQAPCFLCFSLLGHQLLLSVTFSQTSFPLTGPLGWTRNLAPGWQWSYLLALLPNPRPNQVSLSPPWLPSAILFWASPFPGQSPTYFPLQSFERHSDPALWPWGSSCSHSEIMGKSPSQGVRNSPTPEPGIC